ncbi:hypothetical protein K440DRAFT_636639 [Wilcoxina mikolae CBS 423.85]|nr:hypothetical protein K440DRAFT_636639 [Wilcoxina mikolae CBS 423.85]
MSSSAIYSTSKIIFGPSTSVTLKINRIHVITLKGIPITIQEKIPVYGDENNYDWKVSNQRAITREGTISEVLEICTYELDDIERHYQVKQQEVVQYEQKVSHVKRTLKTTP